MAKKKTVVAVTEESTTSTIPSCGETESTSSVVLSIAGVPLATREEPTTKKPSRPSRVTKSKTTAIESTITPSSENPENDNRNMSMEPKLVTLCDQPQVDTNKSLRSSVAKPTAPKVPSATRSKKEVPVVASISATGEITGSLQPLIKRPLIAHLPISSASVTFMDAPPEYTPNLPDPMAANEFIGDPFMMNTEEKYEPISFLIAKDKDEEVIKFLPLIYSTPSSSSEQERR